MPEEKKKPYLHEPGDRPVTNCTIFLGYTSNLISSGIRDTLRYLVRHNMVGIGKYFLNKSWQCLGSVKLENDCLLLYSSILEKNL